MMASEKIKHRNATLWRRLGFVILGLVLFFTLLTLVLEILEKAGLVRSERLDDRIAYGPLQLLTTEKTDQGTLVRINDPGMVKRSFVKKKPKNLFRVFVTGGSFAMGVPYINNGLFVGIPDWVRMELQQRYPSLQIESINLALGGQNSFRVRAIVEQASKQKADLMLVITGNNEAFVPVSEANHWMHKWILYRLMKKTLLPVTPVEERPNYFNTNVQRQVILENYQRNIEGMIRACKKNRMPLALATLPINLKAQDPVGTDYQRRDQWAIEGDRAREEGDCEKAVKLYKKSLVPEYSRLFMAQCFESQGKYDQAKEIYKDFVEKTPNIRTRPSINQYLRDRATRGDITLIDLEKALEALSPHGIPHPKIFLDQCHMTWWGYQLMAGKVVDTIIEKGFIQSSKEEPLPKPSVEEMVEKYNLNQIYSLPESESRQNHNVILTSPCRNNPLPGT